MNRRHLRVLPPLLVAGGLLASGCTLEDGRGFAHLSGTLQASFAALSQGAGRLTEDGWIRTDNSFQIKLTKLQLGTAEVSLQEVTTQGGAQDGCAFDPANPPDGCTLCHGEHCHCDGELKSYEELRQQVCGSGTTSETAQLVATMLPESAVQDLLAPSASVPLERCTPSCELPRTTLSRLQLELGPLELQGTVRDGSQLDRLGGEQLALQIQLPLEGALLPHSLDPPQEASLDQPHELALALALSVTAGLLDGVPWHQLQRSAGQLVIAPGSNQDAAERVAGNLSHSELTVTASRPVPDQTPPDAGADNPDEEGCEHLTQGPYSDVTAGADAAGAAGVAADHHAYRVALTAGQPGFIKFNAGAAGELVLYLDTDVPLALTDDQAKPLNPETSETSIAQCTAVRAKHTVDLPRVGSYTVQLTPPDGVTQVTLVLEEAHHSH